MNPWALLVSQAQTNPVIAAAPMPHTKECTSCNEEKPLSDFHYGKAHCKACAKNKLRFYRANGSTLPKCPTCGGPVKTKGAAVCGKMTCRQKHAAKKRAEVRDRGFTDDRWVTVEVWIPHRMTLTCQQPGSGFAPLPGCINCKDLNR